MAASLLAVSLLVPVIGTADPDVGCGRAWGQPLERAREGRGSAAVPGEAGVGGATTAPATTSSESTEGPRRGLLGISEADRLREAGPERMSDEDQRRFRVFMSSYMPNALFASEDVSRPPRQRLWLRSLALFHFRRLERVRRDFPELAERVLQDVRDIDEVIRLAREYRTLPTDQQEATREAIGQRLLSVARGVIEERERRLQRLREQLEREEAQLQRDRAGVEEWTRSRVDNFLRLGEPEREGRGRRGMGVGGGGGGGGGGVGSGPGQP